MKKKRLLGGLLLSFVFLFIFSSLLLSAEKFLKSPSVNDEEFFKADFSAAIANVLETPRKSDEQLFLEVGAESAISLKTNLFNFESVIFEKNKDKVLPIASLTKLMTAIIVLDHINLGEVVTVSGAADLQAPLRQDVSWGASMSAENFLSIMLIGSSNKSAYALAEKLGVDEFVDLMNKKAEKIGMRNTFFADPTGLSSKNISTAEDLTKLAQYILKGYPKITKISRTKELDVPGFGKVVNTDQLLSEMPEIISGKTGFTDDAKGCLLIVTYDDQKNDYLINVVLGSEDRFSEMQKLIGWVSIDYKK